MKLKITFVAEYNPTPGSGGYEGCETVDDCLAIDEEAFDDDPVLFVESVMSGDPDAKITVEVVR